jgi:hypothetical protein
MLKFKDVRGYAVKEERFFCIDREAEGKRGWRQSGGKEADLSLLLLIL